MDTIAGALAAWLENAHAELIEPTAEGLGGSSVSVYSYVRQFGPERKVRYPKDWSKALVALAAAPEQDANVAFLERQGAARLVAIEASHLPGRRNVLQAPDRPPRYGPRR
jgi:hypothetical protein